ncbi:hypothetical protein MBLNU230_g8580t1 [Neophaeotheca triangularis]
MSTPKPNPKSNKKPTSLTITLRLPSDKLAQWPSSTTTTNAPTNSQPADQADTPPPPAASDKDPAADSNSTPAPNADANGGPNAQGKGDAAGKKKRGGGAVAGRKRAPPSIDPNGPVKEKGRPGPKKKPRL